MISCAKGKHFYVYVLKNTSKLVPFVIKTSTSLQTCSETGGFSVRGYIVEIKNKSRISI